MSSPVENHIIIIITIIIKHIRSQSWSLNSFEFKKICFTTIVVFIQNLMGNIN